MYVKIIIVVILAIVLSLPVPHSSSGFNFEGWDSRVVDTYGEGVQFLDDSLIFDTQPSSSPFLTLLTTGASFSFELDATIVNSTGSVFPIQVAIWQSDVNNNFVIIFSSHKANSIRYRISGPWFGKKTLEKVFAHYSKGSTYHIQVKFEVNEKISFSVSNTTWQFDKQIDLYDKMGGIYQPSVLLYSTSEKGSSYAIFQNFKLLVPEQSYHSYFLQDEGIASVYVLIFVFACLLLLPELLNTQLNVSRRLANLLQKVKSSLQKKKEHIGVLILMGFAFVLQFSLFPLGAHPYDSISMKKWSYIASHYGLRYLHPLSSVTPTGQGKQFKSIFSATFPYPPLSMYIFFFVGKLYDVFFYPIDFNSPILDLILKMIWVLFVNLIGLVIYFSAKKARFSTTSALALMCAYVFNPGVLFESSVWGQFSFILLLFEALSALMITYNRPTLSLVFATLVLLTKQTGTYLFVILVLSVLAKYGFKRSLNGILASIMTIFVVLLPLVVTGYSPFFLLNTAAGFNVLNLLIEKPGEIVGGSFVSSFAYNIWPLITARINGQTLLGRFFYPDNLSNQIFGLSYLRFATIVTSLTILCIAFLTVASLRRSKQNHYFALFLVSLTVYTLFTKMHERYIGYAIPMIILAFIHVRFHKRLFVVLYSLFTATYLIPMYFIFILTSLWVPGMLPLFDPKTNWLANCAYNVLFNDLAITMLSVLNILGFVAALLYFLFSYTSFRIKIRVSFRLSWR